ncbi:MAG: hypothetical protein ACI4TB_00170 [Lachnospiraceae bacterium]
MILSAIMIRQNLTESFAGILYPAFTPFQLSRNCVYCIILGFLCGFPMGARTIAGLYEKKCLNRKEASFLLAFCNNIGPVYYISFLLPVTGLLSSEKMPVLLFGMYGIPLLYGLFLRYTGFLLPEGSFSPDKTISQSLHVEPFSDSLDSAMQSSIAGITTLGGYMVLFNLLNLFPHALFLLFGIAPHEGILALLNCGLEITSGISRIGTSAPLAVLIILPLGGLSCIAQTKSAVMSTDLSMGNYLLHKSIQTVLTALYYFAFFRFLF